MLLLLQLAATLALGAFGAVWSANIPGLDAEPRMIGIGRRETECITDMDCAALNSLNGTTNVKAYLCVNQKCQVTVPAGSQCYLASDCAQYQWAWRKLQRNVSLSDILGPLSTFNGTVDSYLENLCSPNFCTIASTCSADSTALFNPTNPLQLPDHRGDVSCCGGGPSQRTCTAFGTTTVSVSTCSGAAKCVAGSTEDQICTDGKSGSTLWIGIVVTIIGAACNNIGLNLQKLALRKRSEKLDEKKKEEQSQAQDMRLKISALKFPNSFSSAVKRNLNTLKVDKILGKNYSTVEDNMLDPEGFADAAAAAAIAASRGDGGNMIASLNAELDEQQKTLRNARRQSIGLGINNLAQSSSSAVVTMTTTTTTTAIDALPISEVPASDGPDLQQTLQFGDLIKNPVWVLGLIVYISANFLNFAALQFAPQSLVAPLGSISLVVNVIAAPLINKEKFSWKDVVGIIFIVGGSSMTVVFAGVSSSDYNLCVLLKLFQRIPTIIFLSATMACIAGLFVYINIVEKNLEDNTKAEVSDPPGMPPAPEITITTTTTTTTTTTLNPHLNSQSPASTSNLPPPSPIMPPLPGGATGVANRDAVLEWTGSLYSRVYMPAPKLDVKQRVGRLFQRTTTPSVTDSPRLIADAQPEPKVTSGNGRFSHLGIDFSSWNGRERPASAAPTIEPVDPQATHTQQARHAATTAPSPLQIPLAESGSDEDSNSDHLRQGEEAAAAFMSMQEEEEKRQGRRSNFEQVGDGSDGKQEVSVTGEERMRTMRTTLHTENGMPSSSITLVGAGVANVETASVSPVEIEEDARPPEVVDPQKKTFGHRIYLLLPWPFREWVDWVWSWKLVPRLKKKYPTTAKFVTVGLPLSYAALGGLMGTTCTLFAKSTIHLLTNSFLGDNQFNSIYSWLIAGVTVFTAIAQVYWINMGLQRYDALLQIPVFFVVWTVFDVVGGGVYFDEFNGFTPRQYGLFMLAIGIIFLGVFILADRLKKSHV